MESTPLLIARKNCSLVFQGHFFGTKIDVDADPRPAFDWPAPAANPLYRWPSVEFGRRFRRPLDDVKRGSC